MIAPYNIKGPIKKYKKIFFELIINIFSFTLMVLSQQIFALPVISRFYSPMDFGEIIIAFGLMNIITSMFGFSIGNARLLDHKFYNKTYLKFLNRSSIFVFLISLLIYNFLFPENYFESAIYSTISVLGSIRYFFISEYRITNTHNWIFKQNLLYLIGMIIGLILFKYYQTWLIIFFVAEVVSVSLSYFSLRKNGFFKLFKDNTRLKHTNIIQLMINNGTGYSLSQYDRFVIYPILGATNVSLFYSTSISAKIGSLVMNPLSNFTLGKLARQRDEQGSRIINLTFLVSLCVIILYFLFSIISTPILVKILYPSFFSQIGELLIPICLGGAIMSGVSALKPVTMKYIGVKYYNKLFLLYGVVLVILSIIMCIKYGLIGVAFAKVISGSLLLLFQFTSLKRYINKNKSHSHSDQAP